MITKVNILLLSEAHATANLVSSMLGDAGFVYEIAIAYDLQEFQTQLFRFTPQIVIADAPVLPTLALDALISLKANGLAIPLIALGPDSSMCNPTHPVKLMKEGAADYIFKDGITTLSDTIRIVVKKHETLRLTKGKFTSYPDTIDEFFFSRDMLTNRLIQISPGCEQVYGYPAEDFLTNDELYAKLYYADDQHIFQELVTTLKKGEKVIAKYRIIHRDQQIRWIESKIIPVMDEDGNLIRINGISRNITKAKAIEDELRMNEQRFRALLENSGDVTTLTNVEGVITYASSNAKKILGFNTDELIGKTLADCFHDDDLQLRKAIFLGVRQNPGKIYPFIHRFKHANGKWIWVEGTVKSLFNLAGVNAVVCNFRDITSRKEAEENLQRNNLRLSEVINTQRAILDALPPNIALVDEQGIIIQVNESWKKFGRVNELDMPDYGLGSNYIAISDDAVGEFAEEGKEVAKGVDDVIRGNRNEFVVEYPCHSPDEQRWFQMIAAPMDDKNHKGAVVLHINITARKLAEEKLAISEHRYRQIVEAAQEGIWIIDENLVTVFANKKMGEILGYPIEEIIGKCNYDFKHADEKVNTKARMANRKAVDVETHESVFITKSGKKVICNLSTVGMMGPDGNFQGTLAMVTDITKRRADEDALKKSEANLLAIIENTADLVYSLDKDLNFITYNQRFKNAMSQVYGFDIVEGDNGERLLGNLEPEQTEKWRGIYRRALSGEAQQFTIDYPFNGEKIYLSYSVNPIWESGNVIGLSCFSRDITRQKLDEMAIKKSEANLTAIIENTEASVYSLDRDLRYIAFNKLLKDGLKTAFGIEVKPGDKVLDSLIGYSLPEIEEWQSFYNRALNGETVQFTKEFHFTNDPTFLSFSINPILENNTVTGLSCAARDITKQKLDELAVIKSKANLTAIIENTDASVYSLDRELRFIAFNKITESKMHEYFGVNTKPGDEILAPLVGAPDVVIKEWESLYQKALNGEAVQFVKELSRDGGSAFVHYSFHPIWENNNVTGLSAVVSDITQQRSDEIIIKKSEASLRTIFNNTDMAYILLDSNAKIVSFNKLAKEFSLEQNNYTLKPGDYIIDCMPEDRRAVVTHVLKEVKGGSTINYQLNRELMGISKWYDMTWAVIKDSNDADFGYLFTNREITNQKKLEIEREKITADLILRNKALEEFTYVISHNLRAPVANIIGLSSLFDGVTARSQEFYKIVSGISQSADKLDDVISDLNQVLQVSVQVNERIEAVFLSQLIADIKLNIRQLIDKERVKITCDFVNCEQILSVKSSLYSIFNNLILNSIKYCSADAAPLISIGTEVNRGKIIITYKDNGRGIDTLRYAKDIFGLYKRFDTSVEGKGMGLFMVKMQVEGLGGNIGVHSKLNEGTEFVIEFPQVHLQEA